MHSACKFERDKVGGKQCKQTTTCVCQLDRVELELVMELDLDLNPAAPVVHLLLLRFAPGLELKLELERVCDAEDCKLNIHWISLRFHLCLCVKVSAEVCATTRPDLNR